MKKIIIAIIFSVLMASVALCQQDDLSVEVALKTKVVKAGQFDVQVHVLNMSNKKQMIGMWTCSYFQNWRTDNSSVSVRAQNCKSNFIASELLKPGENYERTISLGLSSVDSQVNSRDIAFKLGFQPCESYSNDCKDKKIYWSKPVKIHVVKFFDMFVLLPSDL